MTIHFSKNICYDHSDLLTHMNYYYNVHRVEQRKHCAIKF